MILRLYVYMYIYTHIYVQASQVVLVVKSLPANARDIRNAGSSNEMDETGAHYTECSKPEI